MLVTNQAIDQADSTKVKMSDHSVLTQYTYGPDKKSDNIIYLTNTQGDPASGLKEQCLSFLMSSMQISWMITISSLYNGVLHILRLLSNF